MTTTENDEPLTPSEWAVCKVSIHRLDPIPGADAVEIARFGDDYNTWDYPVVVRKDSFKVGDSAVYIPVDSLVPDSPEFSWLGNRHVRAKKIRGVYSEGLLINEMDAAHLLLRSLPEGCDPLVLADRQAREGGYDVQENRLRNARIALQQVEDGTEMPGLGIERYTKSAAQHLATLGLKMPGLDDTFPIFGVGNAKKGDADRYLQPADNVVVTEKIHGCNIRFGFINGELYLGTHRRRLKLESDGTLNPGNDKIMKALATVWNRYILGALTGDPRVKQHLDNTCVYGELFGPGVQDLHYSRELPGVRIIASFRTTEQGQVWESFSATAIAAGILGITMVPIVLSGPWAEVGPQLAELAEGKSLMAEHIREGVVVRSSSAIDGLSPRQFKFVSQAYRLRKNAEDNVTE